MYTRNANSVRAQQSVKSYGISSARVCIGGVGVKMYVCFMSYCTSYDIDYRLLGVPGTCTTNDSDCVVQLCTRTSRLVQVAWYKY